MYLLSFASGPRRGTVDLSEFLPVCGACDSRGV